jgi:hypothetical protein
VWDHHGLGRADELIWCSATNSWLTLGPCGSSNHAERRVVVIIAGAGDDGGGSPGPGNGVMAMVVRAGMREREMAHAGMWRFKVGRFLDELQGFCFRFGPWSNGVVVWSGFWDSHEAASPVGVPDRMSCACLWM